MKRSDNKSRCPINFTLETIGDTWSLLIVRDVVYYGKHTYGEFLTSNERITTSVLADRLASLERKGILVKQPHSTDRRKEIYMLTEKGLDLIAILFDMESWGVYYGKSAIMNYEWHKIVTMERDSTLRLTRQVVRNGGSIFFGEGCVVQKLGLTDVVGPSKF